MNKLILILAGTFALSAWAQFNTDSIKKAAGDAKAAAEQASAGQDTKSKLIAEAKTKALVNLNTASKDDLAKLPGIGPARADAIIAGRPYNDVSDLKKAKGIGDGLINKIKGMVTTK